MDEEYVRERYGDGLPEENVKKMVETMRKYGSDNRWWELESPVEVAMHQVFEKILLVDLSIYKEGIAKLVGRPVYSHDFGSTGIEELREEARSAIRRLKKGTGISDEQTAEAEKRSIERLEDHCRENDKKLFNLERNQDTDTDKDKDNVGLDVSGYDGWLC